jgi:hypothetical protein
MGPDGAASLFPIPPLAVKSKPLIDEQKKQKTVKSKKLLMLQAFILFLLYVFHKKDIKT